MTPLIDTRSVAPGDRFEMVVAEHLLRAQITQYAGASGDFHPFHVDDVHAREHGFDGVFAHGMLTMGATGRLVSALAGDGACRNYAAEMRRQVWPGDSLTASAEVAEVSRDGAVTTVRLDIETRNQDGAVVLTGSVTVAVGVEDAR